MVRLLIQIFLLLTCIFQASPSVASSNPVNTTFSTQATQKVESEQKTAVFHFARSSIDENIISHKTTSHFSSSKQSPTFLKDAFQNFGVLHLEKSLAKSWGVSQYFSTKEKLSLVENRARERCEVVVQGAGSVFKAGDNVAGKIIVQVKQGTNGKVAVIGRQMKDNVNDVVSTLQGQGKQVEAFSESFQFNKTFNINGQNYSWQQIVDDFANPINPISGQRKYTSINDKGWIADSDIPNTLMYKANQQWAQKLIDDGFEIIDMGYPAGQNLGPSLFYNMELNMIFP